MGRSSQDKDEASMNDTTERNSVSRRTVLLAAAGAAPLLALMTSGAEAEPTWRRPR